MTRNERGVSEIIGYVLVFSLVIATVGTVYTGGLSALQHSQQQAKIQNVERAFVVLDDNLADVYREGAPRRSTSIDLSGGTISVGNESRLYVHAVEINNASHNASFSATPRPIVYQQAETRVVAVSGAVFRSQDGATAMLSAPRWVVTDERTVIPLVELYHHGHAASVGGESIVVITADASSRRIGRITAGDGDTLRVNVTVESPRADAWKRYFERRGFTAIDASGDTITYQFNTTRLYVPRTNVGISFSE